MERLTVCGGERMVEGGGKVRKNRAPKGMTANRQKGSG